MKIQRALALLAVLLCVTATGMALAGCNTVEGVGRDVEALGDSIEDTAEDADD